MVQVHLGPPVAIEEELMKKLLMLAAVGAGIAWFINKQKQASAPSDVWAEASDPV